MAENAVLTVNLNMNGEDRQFRVFDNDLCKGVVKDILEGRTYPIFSFYQEAKVILDVGANIGAAAVYLHGFYTQARILCFEPGADALELLKFNTAHSDRISVHPFGLFNKDKSAKLFKGSRDSVTSSIQPGGETEQDSEVIELREAKTFLQSMDIRSIDILKLDSEGCEVQILSSLSSFIPEITIIYLEYHSDNDRRWIDDKLSASHLLVYGKIISAHRGELCYLKKSVVPSEMNRFEIVVPD